MSEPLDLDRGCVQGSLLGPRLFSMYVGILELALKTTNKNLHLISYADVSYVIITAGQKLISVFKFLRRQMTEEQFLKAVTANYYSSVFYWSSVWYPNIKERVKINIFALQTAKDCLQRL